MSFSTAEVFKIYLHRVVVHLLPERAGESYLNTAFNDIYNSVLHKVKGTSSVDANAIFTKYHAVISSDDPRAAKWDTFQTMIQSLLSCHTLDEATNYLMFLDSQNGSSTDQQSHTTNQTTNFRSASATMGGKTLKQLIQPYYAEHNGVLQEEEILPQLSFTLLGSTSELFPFTEDGSIRLPQNINHSLEGFLFMLLEPALLYRSLNGTFARENRHSTISQIKRAFMSQITDNYLNGYVIHVNSIFHQQDLTLKKVYLSLFDEIVKLRFLYYLVGNLANSGSDLVSQLFKFTQHGDSLIQEMGYDLFTKSLIPYYDALLEWITEGELNINKEEEFFIQYHSDDNFKISLQNYSLVPERVPMFFPAKLAEQLYQIGKTLVFLKKYCNELKWLNDFNQKYRSLIVPNGLVAMDILKFTNLIGKMYKEAINYLSHMVYDKYNLIQDIKAVNDVLMRKGDFTASIIRQGYDTLNEPSGSLTSHKLNRLLNDAIEDSSMKHYPTDVINKIDVRILSHGSIGFESFTLDYRSSLPLVFDESIKEYLRLFNFLFKIKRMSYMLDRMWVDSNSLKNINSYVRKVKSLLKRGNYEINDSDRNYIYAMKHWKKVSVVSFNMTKFINNVVMFFDYELIDKNYEQLLTIFESEDSMSKIHKDQDGTRRLLKMPINEEYRDRMKQFSLDPFPEPSLISNKYKDFSVDQMMNFHQDYITSISRNKILDTHTESSRGKVSGTFFIHQLNNLLSMTFKFLMIYEEFYFNFLDMFNALDVVEPDSGYIDSLKKKTEVLNGNLYDLLYKFKGCLYVLKNDLSKDDDVQLKYFGNILAG